MAALLLSSNLIGCLDSLKADPVMLSAVTAAPIGSPNCASCHAYALHDVNHNYHLNSFNTREGVMAKFPYERSNGIIVCMDCHFGAIAHRYNYWTDTIWGIPPDLRTSADKLPGDPIFRIDSIPGYLSLPVGMEKTIPARKVDSMMAHAADIGGIVEWMTARSHMNDSVDVQFSPNIVLDTSLSRRAFRQKDLSCSSIECHNAPKKVYRWASKSKALPGCPTVEHNPMLDTSCGYSPKQEPK